MSFKGASMDMDDEPLLFQANRLGGEEEVDGGADALGQSGSSEEAGICRLLRVVGWVYSKPCTSGVVLGVVILLPCALFTYMLLYCPPLDIDLSYSAFEVNSHFSAERFDALTIAMKTQLGSWDRHRRDLDNSKSETLQELLVKELNRQGAFNRTDNKDMVSSTPHSGPLCAGVDQTRGDERTESDLVQGKTGKHKKSDLRAKEERPWGGNHSSLAQVQAQVCSQLLFAEPSHVED